ncbi:mitochondrial F1-F0 ATP synthase subunit F of fungi-domain-containing protein [Blastocladiella britannica]|nr:mitochondrial F1-F0 ATP synthase subunit F of fungi-domain-containing protein [Blastocladiella britannica]
MSSILRTAARRGYATAARSFIPPNVAAPALAPSAAAAGAPAAASLGAELKPVISLYRGLPKGNATADPSVLTEGLFVGYRNKHFQNGKENGAPLVHVILLIFGIGYTMAYHSHLKHHKNQEHH